MRKGKAGVVTTEWESSLWVFVQRKGFTFEDAGGGKKALMFQKKNTNIIQRNSIWSAKHLQGRENCKGSF